MSPLDTDKGMVQLLPNLNPTVSRSARIAVACSYIHSIGLQKRVAKTKSLFFSVLLGVEKQ
jgi:hypothetical protein